MLCFFSPPVSLFWGFHSPVLSRIFCQIKSCSLKCYQSQPKPMGPKANLIWSPVLSQNSPLWQVEVGTEWNTSTHSKKFIMLATGKILLKITSGWKTSCLLFVAHIIDLSLSQRVVVFHSVPICLCCGPLVNTASVFFYIHSTRCTSILDE